MNDLNSFFTKKCIDNDKIIDKFSEDSIFSRGGRTKINGLDDQIETEGLIIASLQEKLRRLVDDRVVIEAEIASREKQIRADVIKNLTGATALEEEQRKELEEEISILQSIVGDLEKERDILKKKITDFKRENARLSDQLDNMKNSLAGLSQSLSKEEKEMETRQRAVEKRAKEIKAQEEALDKRENAVKDREVCVSEAELKDRQMKANRRFIDL